MKNKQSKNRRFFDMSPKIRRFGRCISYLLFLLFLFLSFAVGSLDAFSATKEISANFFAGKGEDAYRNRLLQNSVTCLQPHLFNAVIDLLRHGFLMLGK